MINISIHVSLQWFNLNRKISATKITHNESVRNVEQMFIAKSLTVEHDVEAIAISQTDENRSNVSLTLIASSLSPHLTVRLVCVLLRQTPKVFISCLNHRPKSENAKSRLVICVCTSAPPPRNFLRLAISCILRRIPCLSATVSKQSFFSVETRYLR